MPPLNPSIFRAYDIRGKAFTDFDEKGFFIVAQAFGVYIAQKFNLEKPKIFVSGDGRLSMKTLHPAVTAGCEAAGCEVTWGGAIPTPINYFALHNNAFDATIQISASHNPPEDNGLKLVDRNGGVCGEEIQKIKALTENIDAPQSEFGSCAHQCQPQEICTPYHKKIKSIIPDQKPLRIVVDAGNAIPGPFYPNLLRDWGHEVVELFCDLDPNFPHHQPDPERPDNLKDLQKKVQDEKADLGFAYDGDGDRVGIVTSQGKILNADKIMYVLCADFLSRNPRASIVIDAMSSATLINKIEQLGGQIILSPTGHSYIEENMKENNSLLGGEQSGHFMFGENFYGHDDALLASLKFITATQEKPSLLDEITTQWPKMKEYCEAVTVADEKKFQVLDHISETLLSQYKDDPKVKLSTIDGVRIDYGNGEWAIIRCSNTAPMIRVRVEAKEEGSLEEKKSALLKFF